MKFSINSSNINSWRKRTGIVWLLIEVNLISANIFGLPALFQVLPKYGVYKNYCQSSNVINSTEQDCNRQAQQYQNALTLGIIFFNLPSVLVGILIDMFGGRFVKLIGIYTACNYFSKARAFLLTLLVGSSLSASVWYSVFQVLIDNDKLTLSQLSYIWMSLGGLMLFSSFLFLDWKFPILNLGYAFDTELEQTTTTITDGDKYTFAFNMASLSQLFLCPIVGFLLAFRADKNSKQKILNASIAQTCSWILNIVTCIICMFVNTTVIIPALAFNYIGRSAIVAGSQAVVATLPDLLLAIFILGLDHCFGIGCINVVPSGSNLAYYD
ncbi:unnamed protein product [Rotaria sordida]|uniref:Uncharacterized protein n=1 Tax=Rotaria sordida TaxID=392033 RepID=A0A815C5S4_9BILA|nr:unnamed protein product [Rotaria sordida]